MSNNGYTVLVKMGFDKDTVPTVRGGPLADKTGSGYQFEQFHFYWGDNDTFSSKDMTKSQVYLFELHLVLRNLDYPDFASALEKDQGIAVLAFFFRIGFVPAKSYEDFTNLLAQIDQKGQAVNMTNPLPLGEYISKFLENYFTYAGTLTVPPCSVEVTWLYFPYNIEISEEQFNVFRQLTAHDDHLKNDFPLNQSSNEITLYKNREDRNGSHSVPLVNVANSAVKWVPHLKGVLISGPFLVPLLGTYVFSGF
ncbi:carbonic anhydrase 1-like [Drosophila biarmipes]|uniref:carbonic anhydrase 1-like n=1 Tax=Drosophila biarmipes TaxID=125945 RepID=UPI001CDB043C|nr:carbonic anhydrase 1-like [Drosophila biarmipes]